ncbi:uncharacterized protein PRCAT00005932001 [Priceomyces carsonii]|uniref:uncharacterized protein n=1 Tax=Priceomyces carsonii TaxID=28549 RepID=UPI002EDA1253|nr:unnamed protein product [Priceomyces carsonii]
MVGLPRRLVRQLCYLLTTVIIITVLLLLANRHNVLRLQDYLSIDLTPSFFQPAADSFIVDVSINNCLKLKSKNKDCGLPAAAEGPLGDLQDLGGWIKIDKDLSLGNSWIKKKYFSYKRVLAKSLKGNVQSGQKEPEKRDDQQVLIDIAISNPDKDALINGNKHLLIPEKILKELHSGRVFNDKDHEDLVLDGTHKQKSEPLVSTLHKISEVAPKENKEERSVAEAGNHENSNQERDSLGLDNISADKSQVNKRAEENDRLDLDIQYKIPTKEELLNNGWQYKSNGIWLKYGSKWNKEVITGLDILYGDDAVEPRPNWELLHENNILDVNSPPGKSAYLTIRRGPKVDYDKAEFKPTLKLKEDGKFKILQVADLHFSTGVGKCRDPVPPESADGCQADPRTLKFLEKVLDLEKPDFVVLTGDQIFGDEAPDSETAIFKALNPFISRKIPFAITLGNHDDEGSMTRTQVMSLCSNLPFSLSSIGPDDAAGVGNYVLDVESFDSKKSSLSLYFLDTHKYSQSPKVNPGYDWIKESQLKWLERAHVEVDDKLSPGFHLSMAFFHIPLPEYRNLNNRIFGRQREGVTAPRYNTEARALLGDIGVLVVSVGHDHCNEYCLADNQKRRIGGENDIWLCYGGGSGEGGYGGYGNYVRRLRLFELDISAGDIITWKRTAADPKKVIDKQRLVKNGKAVKDIQQV